MYFYELVWGDCRDLGEREVLREVIIFRAKGSIKEER